MLPHAWLDRRSGLPNGFPFSPRVHPVLLCVQNRKTTLITENHNERDFFNFPADKHIAMARPRRKKIESPFSENFQKVLNSKGISLKAASEMMGVPYATVTSWINTQGVPNDLAAVAKFCRQVGYDFEMMVTGTPSQFNIEDLPLERLFQEQEAFDGLYRITAKKLVRVSKEKKP